MVRSRLTAMLAGSVTAGCVWIATPPDDETDRLGPIPLPSLSGAPSPAQTPALVITSALPAVLSTNSTLHVHGTGFLESTIAVIGGSPAQIVSFAEDHLILSNLSGGPGQRSVRLVDGSRESNTVTVEFVPAGTITPIGRGGLADPRGMILDPADGTLLIFDRLAGVLRLDATTTALSSVVPPGEVLVAPAAGAFAADGRLVVTDDEGSRILRREPEGNWTVLASGLASSPTALTADSDGNVYWADGGPDIGRISADDVVDPAFATVPGAQGIIFHGARLYASEPLADAVHRLTLANGAVDVAWASGLPLDGPNGLFSDGTFVYAAVSDTSQSVSAVRLGIDGSIVGTFTARPVEGAASTALLVDSNGRPWELMPDASVVTLLPTNDWRMRAVSLSTRSRGIAWIGETTYLSFTQACVNGRGAIAEITEGVYRRLATDACASRGLTSTPFGTLGWAENSVVYWDPFTDSKSSVSIPSGIGSRGSLATTTSGSFFLSGMSVGTDDVDYLSPTGALLADSVIPDDDKGLSLSATNLFVTCSQTLSAPDELLRIPLDPIDGAPGSPVVMIGTTAGFGTLTNPFAIDGAVLVVATGAIYSISMDGPITFVHEIQDPGAILSISPTPYGGISFAHSVRSSGVVQP